MISQSTLLISLVFVSQIAVLSIYLPFRVRRYFAELHSRYPVEEFPKHYASGSMGIDKYLRASGYLHVVAALGAISILTYDLVNVVRVETILDHIRLCLVAQMVPSLLISFWDSKRVKLMMSLKPPSVRSTNLHPRVFSDFFPPSLFIIAVVFWIGIFVSGYYLVSTGKSAMADAGELALVGVLALALMIFPLIRYVRKPLRQDPFESNEQTIQRTKVTIRLLLIWNIAFSLIIGVRFISIWFSVEPNGLFSTPLISLAIQLLFATIVWSMFSELETKDFSVYKSGQSEQRITETS